MSDVVVLVGNPRAGSRTRAFAEAVAAAVLERLGRPADSVQVLELAEIVRVSFGSVPARGAVDGPDPFQTVRSARLLIVATPAYKGTFTGLLKVFLDQFGHLQLTGTTAVPVAVAASPAHAEATASALRGVLEELGAHVPAPPLAAPESRLSDEPSLATQWARDHAEALSAITHPAPQGATAS